MSLTVRGQKLAVSLTVVKDGFTIVADTHEELLRVSLTPVKHSKTTKPLLTNVIDTADKFLTGVNEAGNACFIGIVDTREVTKLSNISANN